MSNSQEQSLDEDAVFWPVTESCPEFLHCERERHAVEKLMREGPRAFYACLGTDRLDCFLSPEEVSQISGWTKDFRASQIQVGEVENAEYGGSGLEDFKTCYFPTVSDTPAPCLDLGWPEKHSWKGRDYITVHTSPPAEGQLSIREIIRRHLQRASQVIAIVTDRLTDAAVIGDLHNAASRGVPVYIILNQRSSEENFTSNRLRHPNMQVRVLGGKQFCSREAKIVAGELKINYLLVDLETVIHGNYSLTWTDAHLHRQLVTVLSGPVVESFDREFRILFAASFPISDTGKVTRFPAFVPHRQIEFSNHHHPKHPKHHPLLDYATSPPPPPVTDTPLDWEALGVFQGGGHLSYSPVNDHEEIIQSMPVDKKAPAVEECAISGKNTKPVNEASSNTQLSPKDNHNSTTNLEIQQRVGRKIERVYNRRVSNEESTDWTTRPGGDRREQESRHNTGNSSLFEKRCSRAENILEEGNNMDGNSSTGDSPTSKKPIILRLQAQSESFSSLSDIMRKLKPKQCSPEKHAGRSRTAVSELSQSMMNLSVQATDPTPEDRAVPRLQGNYFDTGRLTPAFALMRNRSNEVQSGLVRTPKSFLSSPRPRSFSFGPHADWQRPQKDQKGGQKEKE